MIHFDMPQEKSNIIKVLGFGGGGGNAVNHMFRQQIQNVDFIICNTDAQALNSSPVPYKIQLGPHLTQGLGAGANPQVGKEATEESLEEIRRILESDTKMAFITAGMGGGTGTGGAPTVARICKDLGILTVGIVTTPFQFEGPKRMAQARKGIEELKEHVDTLLVISNDKLRSQFGNLKMKEAFSKADDVLTTAARCITDVINANGHINVDFADVCTVMRNGGVAILGSATAAGENRAIKAIEAATNSPLLNDNDIRGAKWILLNISSAEGEYEYTMEELEAIQNYVREQSGEDTDVIMGMGYDENLGDQLGVTIIATGFDHKDPFEKASAVKTAAPKAMPVAEPQIVLTLDMNATEAKTEEVFFLKPTEVAPAAPVVNEETAEVFTLETPELTATVATPATPEVETEVEETIVAIAPEAIAPETTVMETLRAVEEEASMPFMFELQVEDTATVIPPAVEEVKEEVVVPTPGFLSRPAQIYAEASAVQKEETPAEENVMPTMQEMPEVEVPAAPVAPIVTETPVEPWKPTLQEEYNEEAAAVSGISLSFEESTSPVAEHGQISMFDNSSAQDLSEDEEQKRRAKERINRLRNLSYNPSHLDTNSEFEQVPAYLRRDMNLHNSIANVEDFYSRAQVKSDDNNQATISTLNNFLHGEKPD